MTELDLDTESKAVGAVMLALGDCQRLRTTIATTDKYPVTDGDLILYSKPGRKNEDIIGKIDVQVKGRKKGSRHFGRDKHPLEVSALNAASKSGGMILFAVDVRPGTDSQLIRFAFLSPATILSYLEQLPNGQKTCAILLRELPHEEDSIEQLVELAIRASSESKRNLTSHDGKKLEGLTIETVGAPVTQDGRIILSHRESPVRAVRKNLEGEEVPIRLPVQILTPFDQYTRDSLTPVAVDDKEYFDTVELDAESPLVLTLRLGAAIRLHLDYGAYLSTRVVKISRDYALAGSPAQAAGDLRFLKAMADGEKLRLGDKEFHLNAPPNSERQRLDFLDTAVHMVEETASVLGVAEIVDTATALKDDFATTSLLREALVKDFPSLPLEQEVGTVLEMDWAGTCLLLYVVPASDGSEGKRLVDPFTADAPFHIHTSQPTHAEGETRIPAHSTLNVDDYVTFDNLHLEAIPAQYVACRQHPSLEEVGRQHCLVMLAAAAKSDERRATLYRAVAALADWLCSEFNEPFDLYLHRCLAKARSTNLTDAELKRVRAFGVRNGHDVRARFEADLITGNVDDANAIVEALSEDEVSELRVSFLWEPWQCLTKSGTLMPRNT